MKFNQQINSGFTIVEMIIVILIIGMLFGLASMRLLNVTQIASVKNPMNLLITDIKSQQTKAMSTDTSGSGIVSDFGIYFESNRYILFRGSSYSAVDPNNFSVNLTSRVQFSSITFPSSTIVFSRGSGEVNGFVNGQNTVTIRNLGNGEQKTLTINRYGVITGVN